MTKSMTKENWKKNIVLFMTGQTLSLFGSSLVQYAIMWHITLSTKSGIMMTLSIICGFLPTLFLSPFSGVWADRYNRKTLIMLADALIAFVTLIMAILFMMGHYSVWLLFVVSAVRSLGSGIQTPAVGAFLPELVPQEKLTRVNSVNGTIQSLIMLVSPMLSGALMTLAPLEYIFFIDVITAALAIVTLFAFLRVPPREKTEELHQNSYLKDMKLGLGYIKNHPFLITFFTFVAIFSFFAAPAAFLTPLQVTRSFGDDVWRLTAIEMTFSIGMMSGGLIMATWGGFKNRVHTMVLSGFAVGAGTLALGLVTNFWVYLAFMAAVGLVIPLFNTPAMVMIQEKVEPDYMGRVFSVMTMISSSVTPLGMLVFGPLADRVRIEWLLVATGFVLFIENFFMMGSKELIKAGWPVKNKQEAEMAES